VCQVKLCRGQNINTSRGFSALASTDGAFGNTGRASDSGTPRISKTAKRNKQRGKAKRRAELATWSLSEPIGGWFLPQDPVFSQDERLATQPLLKNTCLRK
jgi:hypothetical protein